MLFKRLLMCTAALVLALGWSVTAQAKQFSLTGGGGQLHIGNGLQLPIQAAATALMTGTVFPPLLVPPVSGAIIAGTTVKPIITVGTKSGYQRALTIPATVLSKAAAQTTVGVKFSNPTAYAVGTNLGYKWPAAPSTFSTGVASASTIVAHGGTMVYSNALGSRFGGPASFSLAGGPGAGLITTAPVSVYIKIGAGTPPCTHTAFGGADSTCVAGFVIAKPTGLGGAGGPTAASVITPGGPVVGLNVAAVKMGATPLGTILAGVKVATAPLPTNMATSQPGPWTTGKLIISNPAASPLEKFTLSGKDSRTAGGNGTIQLVAGSLSTRGATGPNSNRAWLRLVLGPVAPVMPPSAMAAGAGLMLLAFGYAARRRFASAS